MSKNAGNIVLEAKNVVYYYKANKGKKVLDDISYGFEIGKMYAILGPSGSGKTTFLSLLAGLDSPTDGGIYYEGVNIRKKGLHNYRKKNMSLVFQNYNLIDYLTPEENVMLGGKKDIEKILEANERNYYKRKLARVLISRNYDVEKHFFKNIIIIKNSVISELSNYTIFN